MPRERGLTSTYAAADERSFGVARRVCAALAASPCVCLVFSRETLSPRTVMLPMCGYNGHAAGGRVPACDWTCPCVSTEGVSVALCMLLAGVGSVRMSRAAWVHALVSGNAGMCRWLAVHAHVAPL